MFHDVVLIEFYDWLISTSERYKKAKKKESLAGGRQHKEVQKL